MAFLIMPVKMLLTCSFVEMTQMLCGGCSVLDSWPEEVQYVLFIPLCVQELFFVTSAPEMHYRMPVLCFCAALTVCASEGLHSGALSRNPKVLVAVFSSHCGRKAG